LNNKNKNKNKNNNNKNSNKNNNSNSNNNNHNNNNNNVGLCSLSCISINRSIDLGRGWHRGWAWNERGPACVFCVQLLEIGGAISFCLSDVALAPRVIGHCFLKEHGGVTVSLICSVRSRSIIIDLLTKVKSW
jgi:hypothetical protein